MSVEKKWLSVPPQAITADGDSTGRLLVPDSTLFKVKQKVKLFSDTQQPTYFIVNRITDAVSVQLGLEGKGIFTRANLSAFIVADSAMISADEQDRVSILPDQYNRAVYEEEPTVAIRTVAVDALGEKYSKTNPMPIDGNVDVVVNNVQLFTKPYGSGIESYPSPTQEIVTTYTGGLSGTPVQRVTINYTDSSKNNLLNFQREDWNGSVWVIS